MKPGELAPGGKVRLADPPELGWIVEPLIKETTFMERLPNPINVATSAARFVLDRLTGGGWSSLPDTSTTEPKPPVRASVTYISTPEVPQDEAA